MPNDSAFLEECIDWISSNLQPDDVFSDTDLEKWAEGKGYILED